MNTTEALFTRWMAAKGLTSARQGAIKLKVSHQAPTHWRNGSNAEIHIIERMANDLGEDAASLVIQVFQETQKGPNVKTMQRVARKLGVAAILLALSVPGAPTANAAESIHYTKSRTRRKKRTGSGDLTGLSRWGIPQRRRQREPSPLCDPRRTAERLRPVCVRA